MDNVVNPNIKHKRRKIQPVKYYLDGLKSGDRYILSEALTLIESTVPEHRNRGEEILRHLTPAKDTIRIGITGSPGVGKSTFIDALGSKIAQKEKIAILAIDPSSMRSQGSILGDKTRMYRLSTHEHAFIRPTPSSNVLGGIARTTMESILLCEAAGYKKICIETVGVGQSETDLSGMVDVNVLLLLPGAGDEVQGIKRGIMEVSDIMVINKNDGDQKKAALQSLKAYKSARKLFDHSIMNWNVPVLLCSALHDEGIDQVWNAIIDFISLSKKTGHFIENRKTQKIKWLNKIIEKIIVNKVNEIIPLKNLLPKDGNENNNPFETIARIKKTLNRHFDLFKTHL